MNLPEKQDSLASSAGNSYRKNWGSRSRQDREDFPFAPQEAHSPNLNLRSLLFAQICLRWLPTFGKNFKLFLKPQFSEVKFNADSKSGKKKWVSRACFRDNQHLMEAYAGVFEVRMAPPEVIRTKINTHKIIVLCRLNKCTNDGKWTIVQHQMNVLDEKTNRYLYCSYFVLSVVSKIITKSNKIADKKLFFHGSKN